MAKPAISIAEARFAAAQKKTKQALTEVEKKRQEVAKRTAKLRALRLAKEAADREAAGAAAAAKQKPKPKAKKKAPSRRARIY